MTDTSMESLTWYAPGLTLNVTNLTGHFHWLSWFPAVAMFPFWLDIFLAWFDMFTNLHELFKRYLLSVQLKFLCPMLDLNCSQLNLTCSSSLVTKNFSNLTLKKLIIQGWSSAELSLFKAYSWQVKVENYEERH